MAMAKEEQGSSKSNWDTMLEYWSVFEGTHRRVPYGLPVYNHPANFLDGNPPDPAPKWSGPIQNFFRKNPPPPGYDLYDRVFDVAWHLSSTYEVSDEVSDEHEEDGDEDEDSEDETEEEEVKKKEELLDELQAYVESVDVAKLLRRDELLFRFLHRMLPNKHARIRAKGAEVVTTMVQNNPTSQQLVIKEKGLKLLLQNFTSDPDATSRTKALGAISSLIRNNNFGITEFRRESGYAALKNALISGSVCQRGVLNLIQYLLHENSSGCNIVTELGLPHIMMHLASSDNAKVREAALRGLLVLARDEEGGNNGQLVKDDDKLKQVLQELMEGISAMALEDLGAPREER